MSFSSLLNISSWQWQEHMLSGSPLGSLQYTESWSIVYFLIHGENGKYSTLGMQQQPRHLPARSLVSTFWKARFCEVWRFL